MSNESAYPVTGHTFFDGEGMPRDPWGYGWAVDPQTGLTKREMFAAMAMQGLLSGGVYSVTERAVYYADELLAELAKERK
jgi:hypothetical protein